MAIIQNDKHNVGDLLNNRNPFLIPKHQRSYSWEKDEVQAFCNDIVDIENEYFFGGIVSVFQHAQNAPGRTYRVVDGQQRLATFTITIAALRNAFRSLSNVASNQNNTNGKVTAESLASDLENSYLTYTDTRKRPPVKLNRLTLSKVDNLFFKDLIENRITTSPIDGESHKRLFKAWEIIHKKLIYPILQSSSISFNNKLDKLLDIKDKLLENSVVIHIVTDELDEAYQLFEVLNDRGRDLAIGDYLRSTTLELLDKNEPYQNIISDNWDIILSKKNTDKFVKSYLTSHIGKIKKTNVHRQFQKKFLSYSNVGIAEEESIKNTVINIKTQYDVYENIIQGIWPFDNSTVCTWDRNRLLMLIKELKHTLCIPFLLTLYEITNEQTFKDVILLTEKFVFRYITASGLRVNRLSNIYTEHIVYMRKNNQFNFNQYKNELNTLINTYCKDIIFEQSLNENLTYTKNNINKIRYFLTTIEYYYKWYNTLNRSHIPQPTTNSIYLIDNNDIEHIYPQSPLAQNSTLDPLKHNIGNLTFWYSSDNRSASNNNFTAKKTFYSNSNISITRDLASVSIWDVSAITDRKNLYIDIAKLVFKIY